MVGANKSDRLNDVAVNPKNVGARTTSGRRRDRGPVADSVQILLGSIQLRPRGPAWRPCL